MDNEQEKKLEMIVKENMIKVKLSGIKDGSRGVLLSILKMCEEGKSIYDVKNYCKGLLGVLEDGKATK